MTPVPPGGPPSSRSSLPSISGAGQSTRSSSASLGVGTGSGTTRPALEPSRRRLGIGGGSGGERPIRAQIVVAVVVALTLVAVPFYLMKRPSSEPRPTAAPSASASARPAEPPAAPQPERVKLGTPQRVRCGATPRGGQEGSFCDSLSVFEEALAKAIRESVSCAPRPAKPSSLNYVLTIDFEKKKLHIFPGASGDLRGSVARRATECVKRALAGVSFDGVRHQYRHYSIAILATYEPEASVAPVLSSRPRFE